MNISVKCHQRKELRGEVVRRWRGCPELDELTCVPETQQSQQAAGVEEVVVGVEDPLQMSDTEQGYIAPETQHDSDSSDEDIADTQDTQAYNFQKYFGLYFFFKIGSLANISVKCHQRKESRGEVVRRWRGCPELDELTCVPETQQSQQAAGVEEVVVGVEDPLQMSDTEQGYIAPETQHDSDSSDEDIADTQDTQAAGGHTRARAKARARASQ